MPDTQLTANFSLQEATFSSTASRLGYTNSPTAEEFQNIKYTATKMELIRELLDSRPILITSWFRSKQVNAAVKGSRTSAHMSGLAVDFISPGYGTLHAAVKVLRDNKDKIGYDQLILEPTWIHVGFAAPGKTPRLQDLTYTGKEYLPGINV